MEKAPADTSFLYWYNVEVLSVYDADTITVSVDLGFHLSKSNLKIRLARINAWERTGAEKEKGMTAREFLVNRLEGQKVTVNTMKDKTGKYGRMLADVYIGTSCINDELVKLGHARYQEY